MLYILDKKTNICTYYPHIIIYTSRKVKTDTCNYQLQIHIAFYIFGRKIRILFLYFHFYKQYVYFTSLLKLINLL